MKYYSQSEMTVLYVCVKIVSDITFAENYIGLLDIVKVICKNK